MKFLSASNHILLLALCTLAFFSAKGQDDKLTKEVQVVRPYEPSISDAFKLNLMPRIEDTLKLTPTFTYSLALRPVTTEFPVNPIPAAKMVSDPLLPAYNGYVKFGFGNYTSPLAELYYGNERSKNYSYGGWLKHHSSFGNVKLINGDKVDAPYSQTSFNAFGKRIFDKSVLSVNAGYSLHNYRYYAYDPILTTIPLPIPNADKQQQQLVQFGAAYKSTHSDSTHINYQFTSGFDNFSDDYGNTQNSFRVKADVNKYFKKEMVGGTIEFVSHMKNKTLDSANNNTFRFAPWVGAYDKQWRVKAGINVNIDANSSGTKGYFYPIAAASYNIVSNYVIPYFEFSGFLKQNDYASITSENPWVREGIDVWNTSHKLIITGGVKGNLSARTAYSFGGAFSLIDSMYFFVNLPDATNSYLQNKFDVVYDNIQRKRFFGEFSTSPLINANLYLKVEYNIYDLSNIDKPWHLPGFVGRIGATYSIKDKIIVKASVYLEGNRWVRGLNGNAIEINGLTDINLGLEYRYNRKAGAFIDFNNLTGNKHQLWHLYPMHRFNMKAGISFAF
jgi:hypothetical protein